jgi:hypothetical protein
MAIGLLGKAKGTSSGATVTVYTVPAGISHAVVHITISGDGVNISQSSGDASVVTVDGGSVLTLNAALGGTAFRYNQNSVSMMLSPGNVVAVFGGAAGQFTTCTVSGYEVA